MASSLLNIIHDLVPGKDQTDRENWHAKIRVTATQIAPTDH